MNKHELTATWTPNPQVSEWVVSIDDRIVGRSSQNHIKVPTGVARGKTVTVKGVEKDRQGQTLNLYSFAAPQYDRSAIGLDALGTTALNASHNADLIGSHLGNGPDMANYLGWDAFIPEQFVPADKVCLPPSDYFGGNGRDFFNGTRLAEYAPIAKNSKLMWTVMSHYSRGATATTQPKDSWEDIFGKQVGPTISYNSSFQEVQRDQESAEGLKLENHTSFWSNGQATSKRWVVFHASNPACGLGPVNAPGIDGEAEIAFHNDGTVNVIAEHDTAPSHEIVWSASTDTNDANKPAGCVYQFRNEGFIPGLSGFRHASVAVQYNPFTGPVRCQHANF